MLKRILFITSSFLSNIGDAVFLSGLPLYFYQKSGGSILSSAYIQMLIVLTVLFSRKLIIKFNKINPLKATFIGEGLMALVEIIILIIFILTDKDWVILIGVVPLALIYNTYAPSKFFNLQDYFFDKKDFFYTAVQSSADKIGKLIGIMLSGWVIVHYGAKGILIIDILSFLLFALLAYFYTFKNPLKKAYATKKDDNLKTVNEQNNFTMSPFNRLKSFSTLSLLFILFLFLSWEQSMSIPIMSKISNTGFEILTLKRGIFSGIGLLLALFLLKKNEKYGYFLWKFSSFIIFLVLPLLSFKFLNISIDILFLSTGVLICTNLPIQREIFKSLSKNETEFTNITSNFWVISSFFAITLIPIGFIIDRFQTLSLNSFQISMILIFLSGLLFTIIRGKNIKTWG